MDPEMSKEVLDVIACLAREGMKMIVVTPRWGSARDVGDRVVFLDGGVIVEEGPRSRSSTIQEERTRRFPRAGDRATEAPAIAPAGVVVVLAGCGGAAGLLGEEREVTNFYGVVSR